MLKAQDKLFLLGALGCGVVATVSGALYLQAKTPAPTPTTKVVVAVKDLKPNQKLTERDLGVLSVPLVNEDILHATLPAENLDLLVGRTVSLPVARGAFLTESLFASVTAFDIEDGKYGMAIAPRSGAMLAPGQRVDVYVCPPRPDAAPSSPAQPAADVLAAFEQAELARLDRPVDAKLVLEGVLVVSVGDRIRDAQITSDDEIDSEGGRRDVMLELSRDEIARLLCESRDLGLPLTLVIRGGTTGTRVGAR